MTRPAYPEDKPGRILALDVGDVRTGVAVTDPMRIIASPYAVVEQRSRARTIAEIKRLVAELEPALIVVGVPLDAEEGHGPQARKVLAFVDLLRAEIDVAVVLQDECFTTAAAEEMLIAADVSRKKRKRIVDKLAAARILQAYLDENR